MAACADGQLSSLQQGGAAYAVDADVQLSQGAVARGQCSPPCCVLDAAAACQAQLGEALACMEHVALLPGFPDGAGQDTLACFVPQQLLLACRQSRCDACSMPCIEEVCRAIPQEAAACAQVQEVVTQLQDVPIPQELTPLKSALDAARTAVEKATSDREQLEAKVLL